MIQVVSLTGTLAYSGEYGISAVLCGDISYQPLNQHGLSYSGAAEQTDFTALLVRAEQVYDLDSCFQDFRSCGLLFEGGRTSVNRKVLYAFRRLFIINRITCYVKDTPQGLLTYRNTDRSPGSRCFHAPYKSVTGAHRNAAHCIVTQVLCHFHYQPAAILLLNMDCLVDGWQFAAGELDIQYRTNDLSDFSYILFCHIFAFPTRLTRHLGRFGSLLPNFFYLTPKQT